MSEKHVEITRQGIDALNRREVDTFADLTTADFALFPALDRTVEGHSYRGREGIERYFEMVSDTWEEFNVLGDELRDLGDCVLVLGRVEARGRGSGVEVDAPFASIVDLHDGKMSRVRGYLDHGEALAGGWTLRIGSGAGARCEADVGEGPTRMLSWRCGRLAAPRSGLRSGRRASVSPDGRLTPACADER